MLSSPLREMLNKDDSWSWDMVEQQEFDQNDLNYNKQRISPNGLCRELYLYLLQ